MRRLELFLHILLKEIVCFLFFVFSSFLLMHGLYTREKLIAWEIICGAVHSKCRGFPLPKERIQLERGCAALSFSGLWFGICKLTGPRNIYLQKTIIEALCHWSIKCWHWIALSVWWFHTFGPLESSPFVQMTCMTIPISKGLRYIRKDWCTFFFKKRRDSKHTETQFPIIYWAATTRVISPPHSAARHTLHIHCSISCQLSKTT